MLKKWLREPLLHFLLIGAAIFLLYGLQNDQAAEDDNRITITEADVDRLLSLWEKRWKRLPTRSELDGIIEAQIREEVYYREALAMGLEQNDSVVRRRLAQKLEFIFSDIASQAEPTDTELEDYLETHPRQFEIPGRISFVQIYLNADQRGEQVDEDAARLLDELKKADQALDLSTVGDAFMFGQLHHDLSKHQVARLFGKEFAEQIFELPVGEWCEALVSGYGLHLVRVDKKTAAVTPPLNEVRARVFNEWQTRQRDMMNEQFYQNLRAHYDVVIEDFAENEGGAGATDSGIGQ